MASSPRRTTRTFRKQIQVDHEQNNRSFPFKTFVARQNLTHAQRLFSSVSQCRSSTCQETKLEALNYSVLFIGAYFNPSRCCFFAFETKYCKNDLLKSPTPACSLFSDAACMEIYSSILCMQINFTTRECHLFDVCVILYVHEWSPCTQSLCTYYIWVCLVYTKCILQTTQSQWGRHQLYKE